MNTPKLGFMMLICALLSWAPEAPAAAGGAATRGEGWSGASGSTSVAPVLQSNERVWATRWQTVAESVARDLAAVDQCRADSESCSPATRAFTALVNGGLSRGGRARLGEINRAVNLAIVPMSDMAQFGEADVWSAPLVTLASGRGDCEDYAILKYAALLAVGMPADDLRLLVVRENRSKRAHAVLAARHEGDWLSLDNKRFTLVSLRDAVEYDVIAALALDGARASDSPRVPSGRHVAVRYARLDFEHFALRPGLYVLGDTDTSP